MRPAVTAVIFVLYALSPLGAQQNGEEHRASREAMQGRSLQALVEGHLAESRSLAGTDVEVQVSQNSVTLRGKVRSETARNRAATIARRTSGVKRVQNQVTVDSSISQLKDVPDEQLAKNVAEAVAKKLDAKASPDWLSGWQVQDALWEIVVDSDDGTVTLSGDTADFDDMQEAVSTAHSVPGVRAVKNEMTLSMRNYGWRYPQPYQWGYGWGYPGYDWPYR